MKLQPSKDESGECGLKMAAQCTIEHDLTQLELGIVKKKIFVFRIPTFSQYKVIKGFSGEILTSNVFLTGKQRRSCSLRQLMTVAVQFHRTSPITKTLFCIYPIGT